jgi:hypothetical protein
MIDNNEEQKKNHSERDKTLMWKNLSNKERKKPQAPASETSLYQECLQNALDYFMMR